MEECFEPGVLAANRCVIAAFLPSQLDMLTGLTDRFTEVSFVAYGFLHLWNEQINLIFCSTLRLMSNLKSGQPTGYQGDQVCYEIGVI